jgi:hypothetical protein
MTIPHAKHPFSAWRTIASGSQLTQIEKFMDWAARKCGEDRPYDSEKSGPLNDTRDADNGIDRYLISESITWADSAPDEPLNPISSRSLVIHSRSSFQGKCGSFAPRSLLRFHHELFNSRSALTGTKIELR